MAAAGGKEVKVKRGGALKRKWGRIMLIGLLSLILIIAAAAAVLLVVVDRQAGRLAPAKEYRARYGALPHFAGGRFRNRETPPPNLQRAGDLFSGLKWLLGGPKKPPFALPVERLSAADFAAEPAEFKLHWLGHSTLIIELEGLRLLTDPVFGDLGPLPGIGRRFQPPPLAREALPPLDLVLVTHDHYDHLEKAAAERLREGVAHFIVPLGVGDRLRHWGVAPERITELDWDETTEYRGLRITAVTAHHFSGRKLNDRDRTLWASYVIAGSRYRMFLAGDGGYGPHFKAIGDRHGPFDLTLIEIGAWDESWADIHLLPEQTVRAQLDLRGELLIPIHWAAYDLAYHDWDDPVRRFLAAAREHKLRYRIPRMGEAVDPRAPGKQDEWWAGPAGKAAAE